MVATWVLLVNAAAVGAVGVPVREGDAIIGVVRFPFVPNTNKPVPVSSFIVVASCAEDVSPNWPRLLPRVASVPLVGSVTAVAAVEVKVIGNAPEVPKVLPLPRARVAVPAGAVTVTLLRDVALAAPRVGVTKTGEFEKTATPVPVSSERAPASPAEFTNISCLRARAAVAALSA